MKQALLHSRPCHYRMAKCLIFRAEQGYLSQGLLVIALVGVVRFRFALPADHTARRSVIAASSGSRVQSEIPMPPIDNQPD